MDKVGENGLVEIMGIEEEPSGHGIGRTGASIWAFTKAFEPLKNQDEFVAASRTMTAFLRRHTRFKATCAYLDLSVAKKAWSRYTDLEALLPPSPPFRISFHLTVKTCDLSDSKDMLKAAAWFFWEALRQWRRTRKSPDTMLLRAFKLPVASLEDDRLYPHKLQSMLNEMQSIPGLSDNPEEMLAIANKLREMMTWSERIRLRQALASFQKQLKQEAEKAIR